MKIFSSLTSFFNRLKYPQKFVLITLLFVLPLFAFYPLVNSTESTHPKLRCERVLWNSVSPSA